MAMARMASWFVVVAVMMAGWMGVLGSVRGVAEAGVIASSLSDAGSRAEDMAKVQSFLENKVVVHRKEEAAPGDPGDRGDEDLRLAGGDVPHARHLPAADREEF